jgi:putative transposase
VRGYDGAKKINGRKRHILVDTLGLVLTAKVHTADIQDRAAVPLVLDGVAALFPRVEHVWVDQGYTGSGKSWIEEHLGWRVEVVQHPPIRRGGLIGHPDPNSPYGVRLEYVRLPVQRGFRGPLPKRWIVEIILTQLTKPCVEAALGGRDHVADLHVVVGDHDAVNE